MECISQYLKLQEIFAIKLLVPVYKIRGQCRKLFPIVLFKWSFVIR